MTSFPQRKKCSSAHGKQAEQRLQQSNILLHASSLSNMRWWRKGDLFTTIKLRIPTFASRWRWNIQGTAYEYSIRRFSKGNRCEMKAWRSSSIWTTSLSWPGNGNGLCFTHHSSSCICPSFGINWKKSNPHLLISSGFPGAAADVPAEEMVQQCLLGSQEALGVFGHRTRAPT